MRAYWFCLLSLICGCLGSDLRAELIRVGGTDADFDELQEAIDAASPGDTVLVRRGAYESIEITKPITLKGVARGLVSAGDALIHSLPPGTQTVVSDLTFSTLRANDNRGTLVLSQLHVHSGLPWAMDLIRCQDLVIEELLSHATEPTSTKDNQTVLIDSSMVRIQGVRATGPNGLSPERGSGSHGGPALRLVSTEALIANAILTGGHGGNASAKGENGGSGQSAIQCVNSELTLIDGTLLGGNGGDGGPGGLGGRGGDGLETESGFLCRVESRGAPGGFPEGLSGHDVRGEPRTIFHIPGLSVSQPWNPGARVTLDLEVEKSGLVILFASMDSGRIPFGFQSWHLDPAHQWALGDFETENPDLWSQSFLIPELPSLIGKTFHFQAVSLLQSNRLLLSPPSTRTVGEG